VNNIDYLHSKKDFSGIIDKIDAKLLKEIVEEESVRLKGEE